MKKYISLLLLAGTMALTSCEPLQGVYEEIEKQEPSISKTAAFTLSEADYNEVAKAFTNKQLGGDKNAKLSSEDEKAVKNLKDLQAFNDRIRPDEFIPALVAKRFPEWGKGSTADVTYNEALPKDSKLGSLGKMAVITIDKKALEALGISSVAKLTDDQTTAIIKAAEAADTTKASFLIIKATTGKNDNKYIYAKGGKVYTSKDFHLISWDEYLSMGLTYGNFSSSAPEETYLPIFFANKYPYAKEGFYMYVVTVFYNSNNKSTYGRTFKYVKTNGTWAPAAKVEQTTSQFMHNGKGWFFDPTIKFSLEASDFDLLHRWVKENKPNYISTAYPANEEYWFGGSGYYKNFNLDGGNTAGERPEEAGKTADELLKEKKERVVTALQMILANRFPNNPAQVNGIDQKYELTVQLRINRSNADYLYTFKGLGDGKFELEAGPTEK